MTEGRVEVAPPPATGSTPVAASAPPLVAAGERAVVPLIATAATAAQVSRASPADLARLEAWQPQLLDFSATPLEEVLAELNRRNRVQLVLADPASARVPIVASVRSDNLDGFVTLVAAAAGLRAEQRGSYEIVLRAAK